MPIYSKMILPPYKKGTEMDDAVQSRYMQSADRNKKDKTWFLYRRQNPKQSTQVKTSRYLYRTKDEFKFQYLHDSALCPNLFTTKHQLSAGNIKDKFYSTYVRPIEYVRICLVGLGSICVEILKQARGSTTTSSAYVLFSDFVRRAVRRL